MLREMRVIISSLLLILSLHFLLQGINFRKKINLSDNQEISSHKKVKKTEKETFLLEKVEVNDVNDLDVRQELLNSIQCKKPSVVSANKFIDDKNDPNFQSNVLNVNRFYQKNSNEPPDLSDNKPGGANINPLSGGQFSNQSEQWNYKNEFVMNGGELLKGVTGFDNLSDQYSSFNCDSSDISNISNISGESCDPLTRGATVNDDLRMGLGSLGLERRMVT